MLSNNKPWIKYIFQEPILLLSLLGMFFALLSKGIFEYGELLKEVHLGYLLLAILGFAFLVISKISLLKKGIRFSLGPGKMTLLNKVFYFFGWLLMFVGLLNIFLR